MGCIYLFNLYVIKYIVGKDIVMSYTNQLTFAFNFRYGDFLSSELNDKMQINVSVEFFGDN